MHLSGRGVGHVNRVAREIDEDLLAPDMALPHRRAHTPLPGIVGRAEPCVGKTFGMTRAIFLPEQHSGHARFAHLLVGRRPIRDRAFRGRQ